MVKESFPDDTYTAVYDKHNLLNSKVGTIDKRKKMLLLPVFFPNILPWCTLSNLWSFEFNEVFFLKSFVSVT